MKKLPLLLTALLTLPVWAKAIKTEDQAVDLVMKSVKKNQQKLNANFACVTIQPKPDEETEMYYLIKVRQVQNSRCKDEAKPLFNYMVDKKTGGLKTNGITFGDYEVGQFYVPIDCKKCEIKVY